MTRFILSIALGLCAAAILHASAPAPVPLRLLHGGEEAPGPATRRGPIVLAEVHAQPPARADGLDARFVELYNSNPFPQRVGGWTLSGALEFTFPQGYSIPALGRIVIAPRAADVASIYGLTGVLQASRDNAFGYTAQLQLHDELGAELFSFKIKDSDPWPAGIAGSGHSLVLARPSLGQTNPSAWSRSALPGGSPGAAEPSRSASRATLLINELIPHSPSADGAVELINAGDEPIDLSGCTIASAKSSASYTFPSGATIAPHSLLAVDEATLGFAVTGAKDEILLRAPAAESSAVIDAVRLPAVPIGGAYGRSPDASCRLALLSLPTPESRNAPRTQSPVVLNEIMYHPLTENRDHEYIELLNTTDQEIDLTGWVISGDVDYEFTERIPANGYLVVAGKRSAFRELYADFAGLLAADGFTSSLPNGSGTVRLRRPMDVWDAAADAATTSLVVMEEVRYRDGGAWGDLADGGGSSLERVDPRSDPMLAGSWSASDETRTCGWKTIEYTGAIEYGRSDDSYGDPTQVELGLYGAGECLVDSVVLKSATGSNLVANPSFEDSNSTWRFHGTHAASAVETAEDADDGAKVLHVRATGRLHTGGNGIRGTLTSNLPKSGTGTISMRVKWLAGSPDVLMRARGNWIEACGDITTTHAFGTPGRANSRAANAAPAIAEVTHEPLLPANGESVTVYARVDDPDGVDAVTLAWHVDGNATTTTVAMAACEAGWYSATIPTPAANSLLGFRVTALDASQTHAVRSFPADASRECLVRWNDPHVSYTFGTYRFWITAANLEAWRVRNQDSNAPVPCAFIYGNDRVIYNAGIQYGGSPFHCKGFSRPINNGFIDYKLEFEKDDALLDDDGLVLACAGNPGSGEDPTVFKEQFCYALARRLGQAAVYRRVVHLYANGTLQNSQGVVEDTEKPNSSMIDHWFPEKTNGRLYKCDDWFEYNPNNFGDFKYTRGGQEVGATLESFKTTDNDGNTVYKRSRYRWHWLARACENFEASDYDEFYNLVTAFNNVASPTYPRDLAKVADVDSFLAVSALHQYVGNYDSYGKERGKNAYIYDGPKGWALLAWDIDTSFGAPNTRDRSMTDVVNPQSSSLKLIDPSFRTMLKNYEHTRGYWRKFIALVEACTTGSDELADYSAQYAALAADGVNMSGLSSAQANIQTRRSNVLQQINSANASDFTLTSPQSFASNLATVTGEAPFQVASITCNGEPLDVTWTSPTAWKAQFVLTQPQTPATFAGIGENGATLYTAETTLIYTGPDLDSIAESLMIVSIMHSPAQPRGGYVEILNASSDTTFNLDGVYLAGSIDFAFPRGIILAPGESAVVAEDAEVYAGLYAGGAITPTGAATSGALGPTGALRLARAAHGLELDDTVIDRVEWGGEGWPEVEPGTAISLYTPEADNSRAECWSASGISYVQQGGRQLVPLNQRWRYSMQTPGSNWPAPAFDDSAWPSGCGPLGHDTDSTSWAIPLATDIGALPARAAYYFRTQFLYTPPASIRHMDNVFPERPDAEVASRNHLLHRWSFNGSLLDTAGGRTAALYGSTRPTFNAATNSIVCAGGSKGTSWIDLGANVMPADGSPFTIEIWATHNARQNWSRVFDFGSSTTDYILIAWTSGTDINKDAVCIKKIGGDVTGKLAPFTLGTEFHISAVFAQASDGTWNATFRKKNARTGVTMGSCTINSGTTGWSPMAQGQANCWLAHSQYGDNDASAAYNEVRVWNAALSDAQLTENARLGPDQLPALDNGATTAGGVLDAVYAAYMVDDCAAVYLNGREIHRSARTPAGALTENSLATTHAPQNTEGTFTEFFQIDPSLLVSGTNTIAVEVHQNVATSSDIEWGMLITATNSVLGVAQPGQYQTSPDAPDGLPPNMPEPAPLPSHGHDDVRLNEFMAQNALFVNPLTGAMDDWLELYNNGTNLVSLAGWVVTDTLDGAEPPVPSAKSSKALVIPRGVHLAPGEALRIWTGAKNFETLPFDPLNLQAPFGLGKSADAIYLFDLATNLVDSIAYSTAQTDVASMGRWPNGWGDWTVFAAPTPGAPNHPSRFATVNLAGASSHTLRAASPFASTTSLTDGNVAAFALRGEAAGAEVPAGLAVDASGTLSWTPSESQAPGVYRLYLCAIANGTVTDALPLTFTVLPPATNTLVAVGLEAGDLSSARSLSLSWQGALGATYEVEWCTDLAGGDWQLFPGMGTIQGEDEPMSAVLDLAILGDFPPRAFFRVRETK